MTRRTEMVIWMVNELGFYRLRDRAAPQGAAEGNKTLRRHAGDEENLRGSADEGGRHCKGLVL